MRKILGLDIGTKRIGVALAEGAITSSYGIVDSSDYQTAILEIAKICHSETVEKIIVGIPKSEDTFQVDKIHSFAMELAKVVSLPIEYVDEAFTSKEAERMLENSKLDPKSENYKQEVDKIAAKLILEQYANKLGHE